jgi:hypothetical protein
MLYCSEINRYGDSLIKRQKEKERTRSINLLNELIQDLAELKQEYQRIWSNDCSTDNLGTLLLQYDRTIEIFMRRREEIENKIKWHNPNIPAHWIYSFKKKSPGIDHKAFFIKQFSIAEPSKIKYAKIQFIGDTHSIVYLNGIKIYEGFSKRTLSLLMLNSFKQIIDLTPYLKEGVNELVVENHNYQGGFGIINIFGEIRMIDNKNQILKTDETWKISQQYPISNLSELKNARVLLPPPYLNGTLTYPDFENNIPSFSTFILGMGSIALRYVPWSLKWMQKGLSKLATKLNLIV